MSDAEVEDAGAGVAEASVEDVVVGGRGVVDFVGVVEADYEVFPHDAQAEPGADANLGKEVRHAEGAVRAFAHVVVGREAGVAGAEPHVAGVDVGGEHPVAAQDIAQNGGAKFHAGFEFNVAAEDVGDVVADGAAGLADG